MNTLIPRLRPDYARMVKALRAITALFIVGVVCFAVTSAGHHDSRAALLATSAAQFILIFSRQPTRVARFKGALRLLPGFWAGAILIYVVFGHVLAGLIALPVLLSISFMVLMVRPHWGAVLLACAWVFMFGAYFHVTAQDLAWHLALLTLATVTMAGALFLTWPGDSITHPPARAPQWSDLVWKRGIQVLCAVAPSSLLGLYISHDRWIWAILTSVMVFLGTETADHVLTKGVKSIIGVTLGLILGIVLTVMIGDHKAPIYVFLALFLFLALYCMPEHYAIGSASITVVLALTFDMSGLDVSALLRLRFLEVVAGAAFGVAAAVFIFPHRVKS